MKSVFDNFPYKLIWNGRIVSELIDIDIAWLHPSVSWGCVSINDMKEHEFEYEIENLIGYIPLVKKISHAESHILFKSKEDAMAFKLKWIQ